MSLTKVFPFAEQVNKVKNQREKRKTHHKIPLLAIRGNSCRPEGWEGLHRKLPRRDSEYQITLSDTHDCHQTSAAHLNKGPPQGLTKHCFECVPPCLESGVKGQDASAGKGWGTETRGSTTLALTDVKT